MIPTREECFELIRRYRMLPHIVQHSKLVAKVALLIARKLNSHGQNLDLALVEAGALLHDITKTMSIRPWKIMLKPGRSYSPLWGTTQWAISRASISVSIRGYRARIL